MSKFVKRISGHKAKGYGDLFENMIRSQCNRESIVCVRIPSGAKMIKMRGVLVPLPVRSPFDFVIAQGGKCCFIDAKTIESGNFSHSMITGHQLEALLSLHNQGLSAGYLIWYRDKGRVCFFNAGDLKALKPRESLTADDGIFVGTGNGFSLEKILEGRDKTQQTHVAGVVK